MLSGLKKVTNEISAIVNMCDDGGSTGVLRDELGVLPPGDVRQCLVGLSDVPEIRDLFSYRFGEGRLAGQSLGNIILSGLELQHGSFEKALDVASRILRIRGQVIPSVLGDHRLVMQDGDERIEGERAIETHVITEEHAAVWLEPEATANPKAATAILQADIVVMAPGGLYNSLLPIYSIKGIAEALRRTKAVVIFVSHLVNKAHQTAGWHVADYVRRLEDELGRGVVDTVLYNTAEISDETLGLYAADGDYPTKVDKEGFRDIGAKPYGAPLLSQEEVQQNPFDKAIMRTLIRHDSDKVTAEILKIYQGSTG
jgi:uncharacterized cofD-like protein